MQKIYALLTFIVKYAKIEEILKGVIGMVSQKITLKLESGLHARPVSAVIGFLDGRDGNFTMNYGGQSADCKSALSLLSLGVGANAEVEIVVESDNEEADLKDFAAFLLALDH